MSAEIPQLREVISNNPHEIEKASERAFFDLLEEKYKERRIPFSGRNFSHHLEQKRAVSGALVFVFDEDHLESLDATTNTEGVEEIISDFFEDKKRCQEHVKRVVQYLVRFVSRILEMSRILTKEPKSARFEKKGQVLEYTNKLLMVRRNLLKILNLTMEDKVGSKKNADDISILAQKIRNQFATIKDVSDFSKQFVTHCDFALTLFNAYWTFLSSKDDASLIKAEADLFNTLDGQLEHHNGELKKMREVIDNIGIAIPESIESDLQFEELEK